MRTLGAFICVAFVSMLAACTGGIPESATAAPPVQAAITLPNCSSVAVSPAFWAEPVDLGAATDANSQYIVLEGDQPVCVTTFQGLELLAERVGETPEPASNPMPGTPVAAPASNPMPGVSPVTDSNPMPGVTHVARIEIGLQN
jgi:hypothetical protein